MQIDNNLKIILPLTKPIIEAYEKEFKSDTPYKAFSISEDFRIIQGIGFIRNYDLYFSVNGIESQQWWTVDKLEVEAVLLQEIVRVKASIVQKIKDLDE